MKTYRYLVFDIDGTLLDTAKLHFVSLERVLKKFWGADAKIPDLGFSFGIPGVRTMELLGFPDAERAHEEWLQVYEECAKEIKVGFFEGMEEVLEKLREAGLPLGVITSRNRDEYEKELSQQGFGRYFPLAVTASDTQRGKPYPDPMLEYLKRTGAKPEEVLFFGDSAYDMECAKAAGVHRALVLWGCLKPDEIEADYKLKEVKEILNFVGEA